MVAYASVAQLDRVAASEAVGRAFESPRAHIFYALSCLHRFFNLDSTPYQLHQHVLGYSVQNRPIVGYGPYPLPTAIRWLWVGGFHGDEPQSVCLLDQCLVTLTRLESVLVIPCLNVDGLAAQTRVNANHVDLNRNYPTQNFEVQGENTPYYGGVSPASEPETRLMIDIIAQYQPQGIVSVHTPYRVVNYDGPAEPWARMISQHTGYPMEASIGYPTPGSFGSWAGIERHIPTITLELPDNEPLDTIISVNLPAFQALLDQ
jgi:murein peptide amidase A